MIIKCLSSTAAVIKINMLAPTKEPVQDNRIFIAQTSS